MHKDIEDLRDRLTKANGTLETEALKAKVVGDLDRQLHLESKAEGVRLALDYIRAYQ